MNNPTMTRLRDVLSQERDAAKQGDFEGIQKLASRKEELFQRLPREKLSNAALKVIASDVIWNQSIIKASISGVKSARDHISSRTAVSQHVSVYNKRGAMEVHDNGTAGKSYKY